MPAGIALSEENEFTEVTELSEGADCAEWTDWNERSKMLYRWYQGFVLSWYQGLHAISLP